MLLVCVFIPQLGREQEVMLMLFLPHDYHTDIVFKVMNTGGCEGRWLDCVLSFTHEYVRKYFVFVALNLSPASGT